MTPSRRRIRTFLTAGGPAPAAWRGAARVARTASALARLRAGAAADTLTPRAMRLRGGDAA